MVKLSDTALFSLFKTNVIIFIKTDAFETNMRMGLRVKTILPAHYDMMIQSEFL